MELSNLLNYFEKANNSGKLSHSYLLVGNKIDKQVVIDIAKNFIGCENLDNIPDLYIYDSVDSIKIEEIRLLQKSLSLKPHSGKIKVVIIFEAAKLTPDAANSFLKTLEEPPAHSLILLTTEQPKAILPTIISRCSIIRVKTENIIDLSTETNLLDEVISMPLVNKYSFAEKLSKDPENAKNVLEIWSKLILKKDISVGKKKKALYYIEKALIALGKGINYKIPLDLLVLNI